jgi:hypothetical protein
MHLNNYFLNMYFGPALSISFQMSNKSELATSSSYNKNVKQSAHGHSRFLVFLGTVCTVIFNIYCR